MIRCKSELCSLRSMETGHSVRKMIRSQEHSRTASHHGNRGYTSLASLVWKQIFHPFSPHVLYMTQHRNGNRKFLAVIRASIIPTCTSNHGNRVKYWVLLHLLFLCRSRSIDSCQYVTGISSKIGYRSRSIGTMSSTRALPRIWVHLEGNEFEELLQKVHLGKKYFLRAD